MFAEAPWKIDGYEVAVCRRPIRPLSGDILGFVPLRDGRPAIAVGDVAGLVHEIHARQAKFVCESLADIIPSESSPHHVLRRLNRRLFEETDDFLLTLVVAAIDPDRHVADIANGANYSFVVRSHGSCDRLGNHDNMPLGILDDIDFEQQTLTLEPGDQLVFCTDGVFDALGADDEFYGFERFAERLLTSKARPTETLEGLAADWDRFVSGQEPSDDMSMVCIGRLHRT